jgi:hypothetical protein
LFHSRGVANDSSFADLQDDNCSRLNATFVKILHTFDTQSSARQIKTGISETIKNETISQNSGNNRQEMKERASNFVDEMNSNQ